MKEIENPLPDYYILATAARGDERTRVIKEGDSFGVFDHSGMIRQAGMGELGLYHEGTRFLSKFEIAIERRLPFLLSSTVRRDNVLNVNLANPDLPDRPDRLPRDTVHLLVTSFLWQRGWHAQLVVHNYAPTTVDLELSLLFDADYADIFEVRGSHREHRGQRRAPVVGRDAVVLSYEGLDHVVRSTHLNFSPAPSSLSSARASFAVHVESHGQAAIDLRVGFEIADHHARVPTFSTAHTHALAALAKQRATSTTVVTGNAWFDEWTDRSATDMQMMITHTPHGPYPYAGVPWYSTEFGRDGIIAALEMLWIDPLIAKGVLRFLAATQATHDDPEHDAEPGKIIHEVRRGEMAALGEVPFGRYYGSVDATPLFVMLAGAYWRRTADRALIDEIWPNVEAAMVWIEEYGDLDGDGFVAYARRSQHGLVSQGWKDSFDSISHRDGSLATGPIALCEVQAYVYAAHMAAAELAGILGHSERARGLVDSAALLRVRFERAFWCDSLGTYAIALDGSKQRCEVRASNAGHCLFAGIASPDHAARVAETLFCDSSFSGWGIRTLDTGEARYNPISYHNGSVWPHDNALIASGLARYGFKDACAQLLQGMFEATLHFDLRRMPELFCGFPQRPLEGPTLYPVACAPQTWAAGAGFLLLAACLGIQIDAVRSEIVLVRPLLPASIARLTIHDLQVGSSSVDMVLENHAQDVGVHLPRRNGQVGVIVTK